MNKINGVVNYNLIVDNQVLLKNLSFVLNKHICLLGASGSGKTLLLKKFFENPDFQNCSFYLGEEKIVDNWRDYFSFEQLDNESKLLLTKLYANRENMEIKHGFVCKIMENKTSLFCEKLPFSREEFQAIITYLNQKNKKIFYITNDIEDVVYFEYLIVVKNGQIIIEGKKDLVLQEEKILKTMGFSLPFYINMSTQLGYYQLLNKICEEKNELGEQICR